MVPPARESSSSIASRVDFPLARARVHRGNQQEAGGKTRRPADPGDRHEAVLERLPQCLEDVPPELRQLVEEEHAVIRKGHLTGRHPRPAADHRRVGERVVRGPDRRATTKGVDRALAGHGRDDRRREGLGVVEGWKEAADRAGDEGLAGARWTDEQQAMAAGDRDLERSSRLQLTADLGQIRRRIGRRRDAGLGTWPCMIWTVGFGSLDARRRVTDRAASATSDGVRRVPECRHAHDLDARDELGLGDRIDRNDEPGDPPSTERRGHWQDPGHGRDLATQRELADEGDPARGRDHLLRAEQDPHSDRQVERGTRLAQVGRRQVDGDPPRRMAESGVANRAADSLASLLERRVGQPDDREPGQSRGDVDLDADDPAVEADERG